MSQTVEKLSVAQVIIDGKIVEEIPVTNPCQMWRKRNDWFAKHGTENIHILVLREDGTPYKDWAPSKRKDGTVIFVNSVKETNRWQVLKAQGKVGKKDAADGDEAEKPAKAKKAKAGIITDDKPKAKKGRQVADNGETYMEFTQGTRKNGTTYMKQNITENRRAQVMKVQKAQKEAAAKREEKNAKARARRAAKKQQIVPAPATVTETPAAAEELGIVEYSERCSEGSRIVGVGKTAFKLKGGTNCTSEASAIGR